MTQSCSKQAYLGPNDFFENDEERGTFFDKELSLIKKLNHSS